ncbi:sulfotransferase [Sediminibacter sp. Hel_I_10]|uniref:sulfotransferase n=1 Tax=Sediminibacter sp. Hel_I_10 TaxID=1392490 RepID=UPI00047B4B8D|nr:sulfotransferase [Sediminibacter sp. Hel_I_10]
MSRFNKHIIIVGTARSGTSWLSETMAQQPRYRMLFEPEQNTRTKRGYLLCDQWLKSEKSSPEAHRYLKQVFANRVDCDWIAQNSNRKFKRHLWPLIPKKFIIKFVRCNLAAKYMNETFGIPVLHLIRNPYELLASQHRVNFPWLEDLSLFAQQDGLRDFIKINFNFDLRQMDQLSVLQLRALRWCIENVLPLEIFEHSSDTYRVVYYEELVKDLKLFYDICQQFKIEFRDNIEAFYKLPSSKAHSQGVVAKQQNISETFTSQELKDINKILDIFDTKLYPRHYR